MSDTYCDIIRCDISICHNQAPNEVRVMAQNENGNDISISLEMPVTKRRIKQPVS